MHFAVLGLFLSAATAQPSPEPVCTVAGATVARDGKVWSLDDEDFDLSDHDQRMAFARTIHPCVNVETWKGFVDWRASRSLTRTIGWTGATTVWTVYGPIVLGTTSIVKAAAVVPEKKRLFQNDLQADLLASELEVPTPPSMVTWDMEALEVKRAKRQWQVPVVVGGTLAVVVGTGVALFYAFPPEFGLGP